MEKIEGDLLLEINGGNIKEGAVTGFITNSLGNAHTAASKAINQVSWYGLAPKIKAGAKAGAKAGIIGGIKGAIIGATAGAVLGAVLK